LVSIAKERLAYIASHAILTGYTKICPFLQIVLSVSTSVGQRQQTTLGDCAATLDFVLEEFAMRMGLQMRNSSTKTLVRLANGQRVASAKVCDISFIVVQHEFVHAFTFFAICVLRTLCWLYHGWTMSKWHLSSVPRDFLHLWMAL
jgi:hypothetical protein